MPNRRTFLRTLPAVFALLLILQPSGVVSRAAAQQPEPQAASQPAVSNDLSEKEINKEEERGENVYRHSPAIKSIARALHLPVEVAARSFEIINVAIVILGIGIPLFRFLPKYLRQRGEKVSSDIESARKQTQDANSRLSAVEAKLAHLDDEIAKFRAQMETEMRADESRIKAALEEESARIVASAEQEIGVAAQQARRALKHFAAELAIDHAAKQIIVTPEADRALIAEFVSNASKGGSN